MTARMIFYGYLHYLLMILFSTTYVKIVRVGLLFIEYMYMYTKYDLQSEKCVKFVEN